MNDGPTSRSNAPGPRRSAHGVGLPSRPHVVGLPIEPLAASGLLGIPPTEGVLMHPVTLEVVQLDTVGFSFWKALRKAESPAQAAERLAKTYNVAPARIAEDLAAFLADLEAQGLVVECQQAAPVPKAAPPDAEPAPKAVPRVHVTAILAAHNRRESTVGCLLSLFACVPNDCDLTAVLVDDGSTDGTAAAVEALGLPVKVVRGPGHWYWSRSMAEAEKVAERGDPDVILWLNDDVELDPTAISRAMEAHRQHPEAILAGALWSPQRGDVSFTGMQRSLGENGVTTRRIAPSSEPQPIAIFHGNFVLVPRSARSTLGPIDGSWPHHYADLDYAERAGTLGIPIHLLPGLMGVCEPEVAPWLDPDAPWPSRIRALFGRKGWPPMAQLRFLRRHRRHTRPPTRMRGELATYGEALTGASVRKPPRPRLLTVTRASRQSRGQDGSATHPLDLSEQARPPESARPTEQWPQQWRPTAAADLIRLGPPSDGGYVVSRSAVMAARHLISGGLSDDWAFEAAFRELNQVPITVYDGTMGWTFWVSHAWRGVGSFLQSPSYTTFRDATRFIDYRRFFTQPGVLHLARNLTATGAGALSLMQAIDRGPEGDVFVKLDIEGGEYALLGSLLAHRERITGLVMELHLVGTHEAQISQFTKRLDTHVLTFVRANNAGGVDDSGQPRILEMTWTRRDLFVAGDPDWAPLRYENVTELPPVGNYQQPNSDHQVG